MSDRIETARKFAAAMGWKYVPEAPDEFEYFITDGEDPEKIYPPHEISGRLHEHLEFCGRVAAALAPEWALEGVGNCGDRHQPLREWRVSFEADVRYARAYAPDLSHAAMLAAIDAKGVRP